MKTKNLPLFFLLSSLSFQCSEESVYTEVKPGLAPTYETKAYFWEDGFSNVSNARLIVEDLSATLDPEFQAVAGFMDGSSQGNVGGSKTSEVYLQDSGRVFIQNIGIAFSLMCATDGWGINYINQWYLTYSSAREAGQPEEIVISGTGRGSHIMELYWDNTDAYNASVILFEFRGVQIEGTDDFEGHFTLEEKSPDEKYNLLLSGTLTLERD